MSTVHHTRFQALYEVPKSPILFNDFLVSLTDLEVLSVVLLLCSSILNDDEENDTLIYIHTSDTCVLYYSPVALVKKTIQSWDLFFHKVT